MQPEEKKYFFSKTTAASFFSRQFVFFLSLSRSFLSLSASRRSLIHFVGCSSDGTGGTSTAPTEETPRHPRARTRGRRHQRSRALMMPTAAVTAMEAATATATKEIVNRPLLPLRAKRLRAQVRVLGSFWKERGRNKRCECVFGFTRAFECIFSLRRFSQPPLFFSFFQ